MQALCFLASAGSFVALFLIGRNGKSGRRLVALLGLTALFMLAFHARSIVAGFRHQAPLSPLTSLMTLAPWIVLLIAAVCLIRRQTEPGSGGQPLRW
jgi:lipopolysaccharide export LptBFGC system permease protein LptF